MNNEKFICKICDLDFAEDSGLHRHLRSHGLTVLDYYRAHYPRYDKLTGELIEFKNKEHYFSSDFNCKNNLKKYLESVSKEAGLDYLVDFLVKRKESKSLIYSMGQFECRTLKFPSVKFIEKYYGSGSYNNLCLRAGLINRFDYRQELAFENRELEFVVDSREKAILKLPIKEIKKIDAGDYTIEGSNICIERKGIADFCGSVGKNFDRLCRELDRAKTNGIYIVILIEEKFENLNSLAYLPHTKHIRATSEFILHRARDIARLYPLTCQIVCCDGRKHAAEVVNKIFLMRNNVQTVDLQFTIDNNIIL